VFDRVRRWWEAPEPEVPLSARAVLSHAGRGVVKLLPVFLALVASQYVSLGVSGAAMALGGGVGIATAFVAGVLGGLDHQYRAALAFGATLAVLGRLGPFVTRLGAAEGYVRTAALVLVVAAGCSAVVGYGEVRRLQTTPAE
jgi:hypothetical protein